MSNSSSTYIESGLCIRRKVFSQKYILKQELSFDIRNQELKEKSHIYGVGKEILEN